MFFVKQQIKQKRVCCTSLTFDLPLFWKAPEIKADKSPKFDCIYLKLGGLRRLISFIGAGCKLMQDAGLKKTWSTVYKENSLPKMLEGKDYSRCLRACLLTDTALHFTSPSDNTVKKMKKTRFSNQYKHLIIMLWILPTMEIYSIVWITRNSSLRILTSKTIAIYQVFS